MFAFFRRLSKSTVGSIIMILFVVAILASFAMGDIANLRQGSFGMNSSTLAKIGSQQVTDRDLSRAMERRLADVRQQNPEADYATIGADFEPILTSLIDQRTLQAFADKTDSSCRSGWSMQRSPTSPGPAASTASSATPPIRHFSPSSG